MRYNTSNSGLPDNWVYSIAIDDSGNKWIGTSGGGLARFDGTNWTVYNTSNSGLSSNHIYSIAIDSSGNKWIGTNGGLARFDGTNWTVYNIGNSGLPDNNVSTLAIDGSGNKWIGTSGGGLARFDGTNWTVYNTSNSGLPNNVIYSIAIDGSGNKWIGTYYGGLAVYNENNNGINDMPFAHNTLLLYPNPAHNQLTVIAGEAKQSAAICNLQGQLIKSVKLGVKSSKYVIDIEDLPAGLYLLKLSGNKEIKVSKFVKQ